MSTLAIGTVAQAGGARVKRLLVVASCATSLLSAALLFSVEPMFSRMVLPVLGGSSSVWSVAMVVFQSLVLAGYAYAHLLTRLLKIRGVVLLHAVVLGVGAFALPIAISKAFQAPPATAVSLWVAALFITSVGLPCFALSATAPLLQAWFATSDHRYAGNPYFLYRASNLGSFVALLAYPTLIEPALGLSSQARLWSFGYVALVAGIALCGALAAHAASRSTIQTRSMASPTPQSADWRDRARWTLLALIPSGLLIAVTADIATDVASAPFIWVVPLALYLLTFVLAFTGRPVLNERLLLAIQPAAVGVIAILLLWSNRLDWGIALAGHLAAFFVLALLCHTRLYRARPAAADLTQFYVYVSAGGMLGGMFAAIVAPAIFNSVLEYPLLALASLLVRPGLFATAGRYWLADTLLLGIVTALLALLIAMSTSPAVPFVIGVMLAAIWLALHGRRLSRLVLLAALSLFATALYDPSQSVAYEARSFYGVYKVVNVAGGKFRVLYHGTTAHGAERLGSASAKPDPLTYYYRGGPFSEAIAAQRARNGGVLARVALVGLGVGALSCYSEPGESWSIFELDPEDVAIASNQALFRTLGACAPHAPIVLGDGRLTLQGAKRNIDLLLLDVYSSDSVPTHMLTREAFALFKSRLAAHGVMAINIANKHMDLAPVVEASAAANGMVTAVKRDDSDVSIASTLHLRAEIALVARSNRDLAGLHLPSGWRTEWPRADVRVWTDDYCDVLGAILRKAQS